MNIIYFANYFPPHIGAASTYGSKIIDYLAQKGHNILVYTRGTQASMSKLKDKTPIMFPPNVKVVYSNPKIRHPYSSFISHIENLIRYLLKDRKNFKPHIILSQFHTFHAAPIAGAILAKILQIPHVVRSHDIFSPYYGKMRETASLFTIFYMKVVDRLTYYSIKFTDLFFVTAREQIPHLTKERMFKKVQFKWHPNGINPNVFYSKPDVTLKKLYHADQIFLYIGMLDVDLGTQEIIKSLALINTKLINVHILIVGAGKDEKIIRDVIKAEKLDDKVHLIPPVSHKDIPYYINNCDVGIGFLSEDIFYKYCVPVKCLEYMACGKPFITTPVSRDVVYHSNTGLIIEKITKEELADKSLQLLQNKQLCQTLGMNGLKIIKKYFLWENIMKKFEKDLEHLAKALN